MSSKSKYKERIRLSNEAVKNGLPVDPWVIEYRAKNNAIKAKWKSKQPIKIPKHPTANSGSFKKGQQPHNKLSDDDRAKSKDRWSKGTKEWHRLNKDRVNEMARKRRQDIKVKIKCNLRKRLSFLVRKASYSKTSQTMEYLGCDIYFFLNYLESKFSPGMSFSNYGQWHIDHIMPCDLFDFADNDQIKKCFHYTNLQPLWALDNRIKSNKLIAA